MAALRAVHGLGIDVGTTACKAVLLTARGEVLGAGSADYPLLTEQPGQAAQDVEVVWRGVTHAVHQALSHAHAQPDAVALSGAMHSLLGVDQQDRPLGPALTWADTQAQAWITEADRARHQRSGCPAGAMYHSPRLRWWDATRPGWRGSIARLVGVKDFLLHRLVGAWVTDCASACATGLLNVHTARWDEATLGELGWDEQRLPRVALPTQVVGQVTADAAAALGIPAGLPVAAGLSDGAAANLGAGAWAGQRVAITLGTSGAVRYVADQPLLDEQGRHWCYALGAERWLCGGAINNAGLLIKWLATRFFSEMSWREAFAHMSELIERTPAGAEGLTLLPYLAGERCPHNRADLTAALHGLTLTHGRAHLARAAAEAIAYCIADVWQVLRLEGGEMVGGGLHPRAEPGAKGVEVRLTGGVTSGRPWMQVLADVLGVTIVPVQSADASAQGAGALALHAAGALRELADYQPGELGEPVSPHAANLASYQQWHRHFQHLAAWAKRQDHH